VRTPISRWRVGSRIAPIKKDDASSFRARRRRSGAFRSGRRRDRVMMVEAGGTEVCLGRTTKTVLTEGHEEVIAGGLEAAKRWIRDRSSSSASSSACTAPAAARLRGDPTTAKTSTSALSRLGRPRSPGRRTRSRRRRARSSDRRRDERHQRGLASELEGRESEVRAAIRSYTKKIVRQRIGRRGPAHRRPRTDRHSAAFGGISVIHGSASRLGKSSSAATPRC